ncbi:hypothetical protein QNO09_31580 [Streptomyces sp. 378]|uniref:hypothetical protein n=1 Tax=Streptomyces sp. 378 TaxID=3049412 RepID=UPI0024C23C51|nr:hypothetical protein [Streptomyces sp. 378]MDK1347746.1 hypothetical protein [Streptomyces sp. 378]
MKPLKAAALVVGSLVMAGAAAPAVALDAPKVQTADHPEEVTKAVQQAGQRLATYRPEALDTENGESLPSAVKAKKRPLDRGSARLVPGPQAQR